MGENQNLNGGPPSAPDEKCEVCKKPIEYRLRENWQDYMKSMSRFASILHLVGSGCYDRIAHAECAAELTRLFQEETELRKREDHLRYRQESIDNWYGNKRFPADARLKNFGSFRVDNENRKPFEAASQWRAGDDFGFLLMGPSGTGKSHLAFAILNRYIDEFRNRPMQGKDWLDVTMHLPVYYSVSELLSDMRGNNGSGELPFGLTKKGILFLDDLGTENITDWSRDVLFRLFEHRLNQRMPTFITSNLTLAELKERLHERIISRILGLCIPLTLTGKDRRHEILANRVRLVASRVVDEKKGDPST